METAAAVTHPKDVAYVCENFSTLEDLCATSPASADTVREEIRQGLRPAATYTFADGREFFPRDYLTSCIAPGAFVERLRTAAVRAEIQLSETGLEETTRDYLSGVYGVCLKRVTPENIVRKRVLIERIERLTADAQPHRIAWLEALRDTVDELDELERPFSPYFDRVVFGRPPTRDSHIRDVRLRFGL